MIIMNKNAPNAAIIPVNAIFTYLLKEFKSFSLEVF